MNLFLSIDQVSAIAEYKHVLDKLSREGLVSVLRESGAILPERWDTMDKKKLVRMELECHFGKSKTDLYYQQEQSDG